MVEKNTKSAQVSPQSPQKAGSLLKKLLIIFIILMIGGVGFALGIYLKLVDMQGLANKLKLSDYPVIGQYFPKQQTNFEPVDLEQPSVADSAAVMPFGTSPDGQAPLPLQQPQQPGMVLPNIDKDMQVKAKQQDEAKRIGKLARLYESMKPEEVAPILNKLDDDTVIAVFNKMDEGQVAKIMALFDTDRAARISKNMIKERPAKVL